MGDRILNHILPILKIITFVFFIFICIIPFGIFLQLDFISFPKDSLITELVFESFLVVAVVSAMLMMFKTFPVLSLDEVFVVKNNIASGFLKGTVVGFGLILACFGVLYVLGFVQVFIGKISAILFFGYLVFFIIVSIFEELMFRTIPLYVCAERYPVLFTITFNGLLFGLVHITNPGFTYLAMLNITLAGVLFSIFTLLKKNISWAIGIHFGWNFTQGILLGYKVSGTNIPGVLNAKPIGEAYLSGGAFGIEGSIICSVILFLAIVWLLLRNKFEPVINQNTLQFEEETTT